ncbi:uncharacterized protein FMAN_15306 [Fusarium mangiferae]|uniref:Uncharacterized protein n=1 Tax=Fusarium mangiferae TaxID=192010 RepID=A0A1L7U8Z1_FUSMA|nr:uncharacterized protein FMAN_15306 [Fusarium mangiferae]CVL07174.1 uncharacterized protein FMAN_15306 [Fusarium mangiferae]
MKPTGNALSLSKYSRHLTPTYDARALPLIRSMITMRLGLRTYSPRTDTKEDLKKRLKQLELQCKERINLVADLEISRQEVTTQPPVSIVADYRLSRCKILADNIRCAQSILGKARKHHQIRQPSTLQHPFADIAWDRLLGVQQHRDDEYTLSLPPGRLSRHHNKLRVHPPTCRPPNHDRATLGADRLPERVPPPGLNTTFNKRVEPARVGKFEHNIQRKKTPRNSSSNREHPRHIHHAATTGAMQEMGGQASDSQRPVTPTLNSIIGGRARLEPSPLTGPDEWRGYYSGGRKD